MGVYLFKAFDSQYRIISICKDPDLRMESFAIINIRISFFPQEVTSPHSDSERHSDSPAAHSDTPLTHTQLQKLKDGSNKTRRSLSVKERKNKNKVKLERRKSDLEIQVKLKLYEY